MSKPKLDSALSYAAQGFFVVPVSADQVALAKPTRNPARIGKSETMVIEVNGIFERRQQLLGETA